MEEFFLRAYTSVNLGDDMFIKMILDRYPNNLFVLEAPKKYKKIFVDYDNIRIKKKSVTSFLGKLQYALFGKIISSFAINLYRKELRYRIRRISKKTEGFISIGGSIFKERENIDINPNVEFYRAIDIIFKKKPKFFLGCNFGPFSNKSFFNEYDEIFKNAKDVCFRDSYSYDLFSHYSNVRVAPDIIFGYPIPNVKKDPKTVGFSIIHPKMGFTNKNGRDYIKKMAELITQFAADGYQVSTFSFCIKEGDKNTTNKILNRVNQKTKIKVNQIHYNGNIDLFLKEYGRVEHMICGRFHSLILSMLYGQKIYPIVYSNKTLNVLNDLKYNGSYIRKDEISKIRYKDINTSFKNNSLDVSLLINKSSKQFAKLDSYLK